MTKLTKKQAQKLRENVIKANKQKSSKKGKKQSLMTSQQFNENFAAKNGKIVNKTEDIEQAQLCEWIKDTYPNVLYTVDLGGVYLEPHQRKVHQTRVKRGHPDLMFQEWFNDKFCGLAIEFKATGTRLSMKIIEKNEHLSEQWQYLQDLRQRCWLAVFVSGLHNAKKAISLYLEGSEESLKKINYFVFPSIKL